MLRFLVTHRIRLLAVLAGVMLGIGAFTFNYAEGLSYFSSNPQACANCHIMNDQYESWGHSSHHAVAVCVDCHLPHETIPKLIAKSDNGYHHSKGFTLQDFHEPIMIKPHNAAILQENCVRCHSDLIHDIVPSSQDASGRDLSISCTHCHSYVGHGPRP